MSADKTLNQYGVLLEAEAAYNDGTTLVAADDGLLVVEMPDPELTYLHDGSRVGRSPAGAAPRRTAMSGLEAAVTLVVEMLAAGAEYDGSTGVPPGGMHDLLRIAGMNGAFTGTGDTAKWTYTPELTGFDSGALEIYRQGQLYPIDGAYAEGFTVSADGPVVPRWEFPVRGIGTIPTDSALASITYPAATLLPPKAAAMSLSLNGVTTLVMRGFSLEMSRELSPRADDNTSAHQGFTPGIPSATLELTVEAVALATLDPYTLRDQGTILSSCSFACDDGDWLRWAFSASQAQIVEVDDAEDGANATWVLTIELHPSDYVSTDLFTLVFEK